MMNNFDNNLEKFSNMLRILSFLILVEDFNNADLMQYLRHQDELLETIIDQNKEMLTLLKGGKN